KVESDRSSIADYSRFHHQNILWFLGKFPFHFLYTNSNPVRSYSPQIDIWVFLYQKISKKNNRQNLRQLSVLKRCFFWGHHLLADHTLGGLIHEECLFQ